MLEALRMRSRGLRQQAEIEGRPPGRFFSPEARSHRAQLIAERFGRRGGGYSLHA